MPQAQILVVEDDPAIASVLTDYLSHEGFTTAALSEGTGVVDYVRAQEPALIILDVMLPGADGLAICRDIRTFSTVPIIMVTARVDEVDRLLGLGLGADDYVCKPFLPREVVARVHAILRRVKREQSIAAAPELSGSPPYRGLVVDTERHLCTLDNEAVELTPVEFRLLSALLDKPGRVFSRDQLMTLCYEGHRVVSDRTIDTHVKNLRKKLAAAEQQDPLIHSIYGVGYKLE